MSKALLIIWAVVGALFVVPSSIRTYSLSPSFENSNSNDVSPLRNMFNEDAFRRQMSDTPGVHLGSTGSNSSETVDRLRNDLLDAVKSIQEEQLRHQPMFIKSEHSPNINQMISTDECFIEITKVERLPGRCQKMHGLPVCQSDKYMNVDLAACS